MAYRQRDRTLLDVLKSDTECYHFLKGNISSDSKANLISFRQSLSGSAMNVELTSLLWTKFSWSFPNFTGCCWIATVWWPVYYNRTQISHWHFCITVHFLLGWPDFFPFLLCCKKTSYWFTSFASSEQNVERRKNQEFFDETLLVRY